MIKTPDARTLREHGYPDSDAQSSQALAMTPTTHGVTADNFTDIRWRYSPDVLSLQWKTIDPLALLDIWRLLDTIEVLIGMRNPDGTWKETDP